MKFDLYRCIHIQTLQPNKQLGPSDNHVHDKSSENVVAKPATPSKLRTAFHQAGDLRSYGAYTPNAMISPLDCNGTENHHRTSSPNTIAICKGDRIIKITSATSQNTYIRIQEDSKYLIGIWSNSSPARRQPRRRAPYRKPHMLLRAWSGASYSPNGARLKPIASPSVPHTSPLHADAR